MRSATGASAGVEESCCESLAALYLRPILRIGIKCEMEQAALEEVLRDELAGLRVVLHDVREGQVRPAQREIDGWFFHGRDEVREVIARGEPRENAIAFPAPRDDLLVNDAVRREVPAILGGISRDALQQAVIIPTQRDEDVLLPGLHEWDLQVGRKGCVWALLIWLLVIVLLTSSLCCHNGMTRAAFIGFGAWDSSHRCP